MHTLARTRMLAVALAIAAAGCGDDATSTPDGMEDGGGAGTSAGQTGGSGGQGGTGAGADAGTPATGPCAGKDDGAPCADADPCTEEDACQDEKCVGTAVVCDAPPPDECRSDDSRFRTYATPGTCNPEAGGCQYQAVDVDCAGCRENCLEVCAGIDCDDTQGGCRAAGACDPTTDPPDCTYKNLEPNGTACFLAGETSSRRGLCVSGACVQCTLDADCQTHFAGYRCDAATSSCHEACAGEKDARCADAYHCEASACVADVARGDACDEASDCAEGLDCGNGVCCTDGRTCCDDNGPCAPSTCNLTLSECYDSCTAEDDSGCDAAYHCDTGLCEIDLGVSGSCDEDSDCGGTLHCQNGACCAGAATCCTSDTECGTNKCEGATSSCFDACTAEDDSRCRAGYHCEAGLCTTDASTGDACDEQSDCGAGLHCDSAVCCAVGRDCCSSLPDCATASVGYACDAPTSACYDACDGETDTKCAPGYHCEADVCVADEVAPAACDEASDCATGLHCENTVCCADGEVCCATHDDCETCEKCDGATGTCVLQTAFEDLKNDCTDLPSNCDVGTCSGVATRCGTKSEGASCGVCASCSDVGACEPNSTDHADCAKCQKCDAGSCVAQTDEDLKAECPPFDCDAYLAGFAGGVCSRFNSATAANGECKTGGQCYSVLDSCTDPGNVQASCDAGCADRCPAGQPAADFPTLDSICHTEGVQNCLGYSACDGSGLCAPITNGDCYSILQNNPGSPSGVYEIDPDGAGGGAPFSVYCDMTTDGGGWTLIANRVPTSDSLGMQDLDVPHGVYDSSMRGTNFNVNASVLYKRSQAVIFATRLGGERCNDQGIGCYANVLKVALPDTFDKEYTTTCSGQSSGAPATKLAGVSPGNYTAYLCEDSLGWGSCNGEVCHYGAHYYNTSNDGNWSSNQPMEIHVATTRSGYKNVGGCMHCNGGTNPGCCNSDDTVNAVFTIWLKGGAGGTPLDPLASACAVDIECDSRHCADGLCCENSCEGTCRACDLVGSEGMCTEVPDGDDPDLECNDYTCTNYVYGWNGLSCARFAGPTLLNGTCNGNSGCNNLSASCAGAGTATATCGDTECQRGCAALSSVSSYDSLQEVCYADFEQHACAVGQWCDASASCASCDDCTLDATECVNDGDGNAYALRRCGTSFDGDGCTEWGVVDYCDSATCSCAGASMTHTSCLDIHTTHPAWPSGNYTIDPDGAGAGKAFNVYCDMVTDGGGWTLIANRLPFIDGDGMDDLTAASGSYDSANRDNSFNVDVRGIYPTATQLMIATKLPGVSDDHCGGQDILPCYANVLRVELDPSTSKQYSVACGGSSSPHDAVKRAGTNAGPSTITAYFCDHSLGWGSCSSNVCHYGTHSSNTSSDGSWSSNQTQEIHVPSKYSGYRAHSYCRACNGGVASMCCSQEGTANESFTLWLR